MSDHKISADGLRIECTAPAEANCRFRPPAECESETWGKEQCNQCPETHARIHGQDCWKIEWVNAARMLDDTYTGPGAPVTIYPGKAVELEWSGIDEGVFWDYTA